MDGTINALGILTIPIGTALVLWRYGHWPPRFWPVLAGIGYGLLAMLIGQVCTAHACDSGEPFMQLAIPALCIGIVHPMLSQQHIRCMVITMLYVVMLILGFKFVGLVHTSGYHGNPSRINKSPQAVQQSNLHMCQNYYEEVMRQHPETAQRNFSAGWLEQSAVLSLLPEEFPLDIHKVLASYNYQVYPLWHTRITGLYGKRGIPVKVWYPGGKLKDGIKHIAFRIWNGS